MDIVIGGTSNGSPGYNSIVEGYNTIDQSNSVSLGYNNKFLLRNEICVGNIDNYIFVNDNDIIISCKNKQVSITNLFQKLEALEEENNEIRNVLNDVIDYRPGGEKYDKVKNDFYLKAQNNKI